MAVPVSVSGGIARTLADSGDGLGIVRERIGLVLVGRSDHDVPGVAHRGDRRSAYVRRREESVAVAPARDAVDVVGVRRGARDLGVAEARGDRAERTVNVRRLAED